MRATFLILLLTGSLASASPGPLPSANAKPAQRDREQARSFARQLQYLLGQIAEFYLEPLASEDLHVAALTGLYQAARKPVPSDLRAQVRQASNLAQAIRSKSSPDFVVRPGDDPREQLLARVRESLAPSLEGNDPLRAAVKGILTLLDEHSGLSSVEDQRLTASMDRYCVGVGLEFSDRAGLGPLAIDTVHLGSAAQRVGLRPGDSITHIDDKVIAGVDPAKLVALRTQRVFDAPTPLYPRDEKKPDAAGKGLRLTYRRFGDPQERSAVLSPERFRPESVLGVRRKDDNRWDHWLDEKERLAYLRLTSLSRGTAIDLRSVLEELRSLGVRGLILDLRWCPGGFLNESIDIADLFLGVGVITTEKSRNREEVVYRSADGDKFRDFPLVVLVNARTSGGAELIAAALQDHGRAKVVGQRTRGKASVQVPLEVGDGVTLKLTKGTFLRPGGKNLHRFPRSGAGDDWGVIPDEDCRVSPQLSNRLEEWHHGYALRPGASSERLPLDDPATDSQRLVALTVLRTRAAQQVVPRAAGVVDTAFLPISVAGSLLPWFQR